jgi:hypothetical protein
MEQTMNMISTGSFLNETSASNKQNELVKKLTSAWEKKNSKTARAGGVSLMALSLAACGSEDDTPFSQVDVDTAKADAAGAALTDTNGTQYADVDAAIVSNDPTVTTAALTDAYGNVYASVDAAIATAGDITADNVGVAALAKETALTDSDGVKYVSVDAAIVSNDTAIASNATTAALTGSDGTVYADVDTAVTSNDTDVQTAALTASDGTVYASVDGAYTAGNTAAQTAMSSGVDATTTDGDILIGTLSDDAYTGSSSTYQANDIYVDRSSSDNDTLTITATDDITATPVVSGIENVVVNFNAFTTAAGTTTTGNFAADDIAASSFTVDVTKLGSSIVNGAVTGLATGSSVTFSSDFTTAVTATGDDNASISLTGSAATLTANSGGTLTAATITGTSTGTSTMSSDSDGSITATASGAMTITASDATTATLTAAGDMIMDVDAATTVVATSTGGAINADGVVAGSAVLTAATSVTLTAADEVNVKTTAATTATLSGGGSTASTIEDTTATTLTSLSLSGNGSAHTFDITGAANDIATVTATGSQNVTLIVDAADIDTFTSDVFTFTDNSSATTTVDVSTDGNVNLSSGNPDVVELSAAAYASTLTVASGQAVTISADLTATATIDGVDATAAANTVAITLNDGNATNSTGVGSSGAGQIVLTDFGSATIDASADDGTSTITDLDGSADNTDVTITAGSNGVTLAGTNTIGTGDLTITSTGAVGLGAAGLTANSVTVTGSGAVTYTALDASAVATMTTGSGIDQITVSGTNGDLTLTTGDANDIVTLSVDATASKTMTIAMGDGTLDEVQITDTVDLTAGAGVTLSGVERLDFVNVAGATTATMDSDDLDGQSFIITETGGATVNLTLSMNSDTSVDLSSLIINSGTIATTDSIIISEGANTSNLTVTGADYLTNNITTGTGNDNVTGGSGIDIVLTGSGNDTISDGEGVSHITAGDGGDTIVLTETTSVQDNVVFAALSDGSAAGSVGATFSGYDVITGFTVGTDKLIFDSNYQNDGAVATAIITALAEDVFASTLATVGANDLAVSEITDADAVAAFLQDVVTNGNNGAAVMQGAGSTDIIGITFGTTSTALYIVDDGGDAIISASEVQLLATVDAVITTADTVIA